LLAGGEQPAYAFIDEAVRLYASALFAGVARIAVEDVELSGTVLAAGSDVRISTAAANRDPAVFPDPDEFVITRDNSRSLGYGAGMRHCPADSLARDVMAMALTSVHEGLPRLSQAQDLILQDSMATRLIKSLPVTFG
jgi:cytochrome P450